MSSPLKKPYSLIAASAVAMLLSACNGGGGDDTVDPVTPPPPPPPAPTTLVIRGQVIDQPIANATIVVTAGDQTYTTTATANGDYEIALPMDDDATGGFVTLTATGSGPQAAAELTSLLGTTDTLMAQAGDDLELVRSENPNTNVTNLTTAEAVLVQQANDGVAPATDEELALALTQVDPVQALNIAAAIKLVIDSGVPLPAGVTSTLELASDPATVNAFIVEQQTNNAEAFELALNDTISNPAIVAAPTAETVPEFAYAIVSATTDPQTLFGGAANGSLAFQYSADGTGAFWTSNGFSDAMNWTLDGTDIVSTFTTNPSFTFTNFPRDPDTGQQIQIFCSVETTEVRVRRLSGTAANVTETQTVDCDDDRFDESGSGTQTLLFATTSQLETLTAADIAGNSLTLTIYEPSFDTGLPGAEPMATDIVTFNADGTGSTRLRGRTLTWAIDGGSVDVAYSNGVNATYTVVRDFVNNGGLVLADFERADGERRVAGSITFEADPAAPAPTLVSAPGTYYQYGIGTQTSEGTDPRLKGFAIELSADGTAAQRTDFITGGVRATGGAFNRNWTILDDGAIRLEQPFNLNNGQFDLAGCPIGNTLPNCIVLDRRDIYVVNSSADDRVSYVVERRVFDFAQGIGAETPVTFFARFYEVAPNGDYAADRAGEIPAEPVRGPATRAFAPKAVPTSN